MQSIDYKISISFAAHPVFSELNMEYLNYHALNGFSVDVAKLGKGNTHNCNRPHQNGS